MEKILNAIFPSRCLFCGRIGDIFCQNCLSSCLLLEQQRCIVCDLPDNKGNTHERCLRKFIPTQFISVYQYEGLVRECIRSSKYRKREFMALKQLVHEGVSLLLEWGQCFESFVCVPIPVTKAKYDLRGFNQAEIISGILSARLKIKHDCSLLSRKKETVSQHGIDRKSRFRNLADAFLVEESKVKGKKILLVDDISTTGATFLEAAKTLYKNGALEVRCFSLSKKVLL